MLLTSGMFDSLHLSQFRVDLFDDLNLFTRQLQGSSVFRRKWFPTTKDLTPFCDGVFANKSISGTNRLPIEFPNQTPGFIQLDWGEYVSNALRLSMQSKKGIF